MNEILTDAQVADMLGCEPETVNQKASAGALPAVKFGRSWRFPREALLKVLNEQALANKPAPRAPVATTAAAPAKSRRSARPRLVAIPTAPPNPRP